MKKFRSGMLMASIFAVLLCGSSAFGLSVSAVGAGGAWDTVSTGQVISSPVTIAADFQITDVTVTLYDFSHTWIGDLSVILTNLSTGTSVDLLRRPNITDPLPPGGGGCCGSAADFDGTYAFNDAFAGDLWGSLGLSTIPGGDYFPTTDNGDLSFLSAFIGESSLGDWELAIWDDAGGDGGFLDSWELTLTGTAASVPEPATMLLLGMGSLGLLAAGRKKFFKK